MRSCGRVYVCYWCFSMLTVLVEFFWKVLYVMMGYLRTPPSPGVKRQTRGWRDLFRVIAICVSWSHTCEVKHKPGFCFLLESELGSRNTIPGVSKWMRGDIGGWRWLPFCIPFYFVFGMWLYHAGVNPSPPPFRPLSW